MFLQTILCKIFSEEYLKVERIEKLWYLFFCIFRAPVPNSTKCLFLQRRLDTRLYPHAILRKCYESGRGSYIKKIIFFKTKLKYMKFIVWFQIKKWIWKYWFCFFNLVLNQNIIFPFFIFFSFNNQNWKMKDAFWNLFFHFKSENELRNCNFILGHKSKHGKLKSSKN